MAASLPCPWILTFRKVGIMSRYHDAIIAAVLLGVAGVFTYEISNISAEHFRRAPGIVYYPLLLSAALALASLVLFARDLLPSGRENRVVAPQQNEEAEGDHYGGDAVALDNEFEEDTGVEGNARSRASTILPVLLGVFILIAYVLMLPVAGFIVSTPVMLVALLAAYGVRNWKVIVVLPTATTAIIYLAFYYMLRLQLP